MLKYFYKNKLRYDKGQLAPFFIVILVVMIIMAMVTVNLSKVAFTKAESANAVDAGGLAAGSVMANLFNAIGKASKDMEKAYRIFFNKVSIAFTMCLEYLTNGQTLAFEAKDLAQKAMNSYPCQAVGLLNQAVAKAQESIKNLKSLKYMMNDGVKPQIEKFHQKQFEFYKKVRELAKESRCKARKMGHKLSFMNSGIGAKVTDRDGFNNFVNNLACEETYNYSWQDGQGRRHSIESKVSIAEVNKFELKISKVSFSEEKQLIEKIIKAAENAIALMNRAILYYQIGAILMWLACWGIWIAWILAIFFIYWGINANDSAMATLKPAFADITNAWEKLLPKDGAFTSSSDGDAEDKIICWIDEIDHDYRVRVDNTQEHQGREETGIWNARYPQTKSHSVVSFAGKGQIHRPKGAGAMDIPILRFNASIIETDKVK